MAFQVKKRSYRGLVYRLIILFLLVIIFLLTKAVWGMYQRNSLAEFVRSKTETELQDLELKQAKLKNDVAWLKSVRGQEEEVRKNFLVAKPGEGVFLIVDADLATVTPIVTDTKSSWWQTVKGWFNN